jgi:hypothetical protein
LPNTAVPSMTASELVMDLLRVRLPLTAAMGARADRSAVAVQPRPPFCG